MLSKFVKCASMVSLHEDIEKSFCLPPTGNRKDWFCRIITTTTVDSEGLFFILAKLLNHVTTLFLF